MFSLHKTWLLSVLIFAACNNASKHQDDNVGAEKHNDAKFEKPQQKDAQFVVDAADINLKEIQLGELAKQNATLPQTRRMAQMMVTDHQKAYNDLSALAKSKNISIPTAMSNDAQNDYKKLADDKTSQFDKDYCDMMVNGHKDAIDKFTKASTDLNDVDVRTMAVNMLPSLRQHLDTALTCQQLCKDMKK